MGLAKLSDGTPGVQKQKGEKKWTKKGAAIVAELLKTRTVSMGILQPDSEPEYTICCITDVLSNDRLFTCVSLGKPFTLKTSKWEEQSPDSFLVGVISHEGTEGINRFGTMAPRGYNYAYGGRRQGNRLSKESLAKIGVKSKKRMAEHPEIKERLMIARNEARRRRGCTVHRRLRDPIQVICLETGKRYTSINEASIEIGRRTLSIRKCLRGEVNTVGGYHRPYDQFRVHRED